MSKTSKSLCIPQFALRLGIKSLVTNQLATVGSCKESNSLMYDYIDHEEFQFVYLFSVLITINILH